MRDITTVAAAVLLGALTAGVPLQAQWPQFRGPNGSGVDTASGYPVEFSPSRNAIWKVAVPYGQSSPIVAGGRVYLTASEGDRLVTIAMEATSGRELWRRDVRKARAHDVYKDHDPATPTPVADESGVVAFFPDFGLVSYSADGRPGWTHPLGPFKNFYGMASSPVIVDDLVVLVCDQVTGSFMIALDRGTGRVRWKTDRAGAAIGWATPMAFRPPTGPATIVVLGSTRLDAYDLSGRPRWWLPIGSGGSMGTTLASGETILLSTLGSTEPSLPTFAAVLAQYDRNKDGRLTPEEFRADKELADHFGWIDTSEDKLIVEAEWNTARMLGIGEFGAIAVRPGRATGRLPASAVVWRYQKNLPYVPAPLLYRDIFYMVRDGGIVSSLDPATGRVIKVGRSPEALGGYYASPIAADGKVFLASREGKITVLRAAGEWDVLGVNDLAEEIHATPALSAGRIYVRTRTAVYCFGEPSK